MSDTYDMLLVIGDWSQDGHSLSDNYGFTTNTPITEIQLAYKRACKSTGISFNHNDDFTGIERDWRIRTLYHMATEYDKPFVYEEGYEILEQLNCPLLDRFHKHTKGHKTVYAFCDTDPFKHFMDLWWWFVGLELPDLEFKFSKSVAMNAEPINGFWDDNLNVQFGYGLYAV